MPLKKKKRIRKKDQITALNGTVIDSLDSESKTDAPSIRAVNTIKNRVTLIEDNGVTVGDTLPIESAFLFSGDIVPNNYEIVEPPFSNPNLLINGDFQVWQRGENFLATGYTSDRWLLSGTGATVTKDNEKCKIVTTTNSVNFTQYFTEKDLMNKQLTATITYIKNNIPIKWTKSFKCTNINTLEAHSLNDTGIDLYVFYDSSRKACAFHFYIPNNYEIIFDWIKLEIGEIATPFAPKSYAQELMECQYYYEYIDNILFVAAGDKTYEYYQYYSCTTDFKVKKRINPSFKYGKVEENASSKVVSLSNAFSNQNRITNIQLTSTSTDLGILMSDVEIDAEIY